MATASRHLIVAHEVEENAVEAELGGVLGGLIMCDKETTKPGHHSKFIAMDEFGTDHLPALPQAFPLSKEDIARWVKSCSPMVVRINMKYVSQERPDSWDGKNPYPFSNRKGKKIRNCGSGWVSDFTTAESDNPFTNCPICQQCRDEGREKETCWNFTIYTARHVIYDDKEARECEVVFLEDHPKGVGSFKMVHGMMDHADTDADSCWMTCYTHDAELGARAEEARNTLYQTRWDMKQILSDYDAKFKTAGHPEDSEDEDEGPEGREDEGPEVDLSIPVVCISHPHGRMKYVSVGQLTSEEGGAVTYTTPTCPGSSGGLVLSTGQWVWDEIRQRWVRKGKKLAFVTSHPHKGAIVGGHGCSTVGVIYSPQI